MRVCVFLDNILFEYGALPPSVYAFITHSTQSNGYATISSLVRNLTNQ